MKKNSQITAGLQKLRYYWRFWIVAAVAASFGITLWLGLQQSVWFDEAYSISLIRESYAQLVSLTAVGVHPPLYYVLLKGWSELFGMGEVALRSFSALCGAAAAGIGLVLVRRLFGMRAMVLATPLVLLAPFLLRYGFEIRMYALASLVGVAATYALVRAVQATHTRVRWWIIYSVLVAAGMYVLYYMAFIWITHLVWLLYRQYSRQTTIPLYAQPWIMAYLGSVLLYVPWIPTFVEQFKSPALSGISQRVGWEQLTDIFSFMFIYKPHWELGKLGYVLIAGIAIGLVTLVVLALRKAGTAKPYLWLLVLYFAVPIAVLALGSIPPLRPLFVVRYISHFDIAGILLIGVCLAIVFRNRLRYAIGLGAIITGILLYGVYNLQKVGNFNYDTLSRPQAKQAVQAIGNQCPPHSVLIAGSPLIYFELRYYLPGCDIRFYSTHAIGPGGGYATIYQSPNQYYNGDALAASTVYVIYAGQRPELPTNFVKIFSQQFKEYQLDIYQQ